MNARVPLTAAVIGALALPVLAGTTPTTSGPSDQSGYVSRSDYNQLKQEFDALKKQVNDNSQKLPNQAEIAQYKQMLAESSQQTSEDQSIDQYFDSAFGARTKLVYFSPMDLMNPANRLAYTNFKLGQWKDLSLYMGLATVGRLQALGQSDVYINGVAQHSPDVNFQTAYGDLAFKASVPGKFDVYFDLFMASPGHPNTMYGHEGFMLFKAAPGGLDNIKPIHDLFQVVNVKVGAFDIDFGDQQYRRSVNAYTQRNPLIGNYVIDPESEEIGAEVYSKPVVKPFVLGWLASVTNGSTTGHFQYAGGLGYHGKLWTYLTKNLRVSVSGYYTDHSGNPGYPSGTIAHLFSGNRSNGPLAAVFGGGDATGQVTPGKGENVAAGQGDVTWEQGPWEVYGNIGWMQDADTNGSAAGHPRDSWWYGTGEVVYHITPALYAAARYSAGFANQVNNNASNGKVQRIEVGGGYWVTNTILAKASYINEWMSGFSQADGLVAGVDAYRGPSFSGGIAEVSFGF